MIDKERTLNKQALDILKLQVLPIPPQHRNCKLVECDTALYQRPLGCRPSPKFKSKTTNLNQFLKCTVQARALRIKSEGYSALENAALHNYTNGLSAQVIEKGSKDAEKYAAALTCSPLHSQSPPSSTSALLCQQLLTPPPPQSSLSHLRYGKLAVKFAKNTNKIETKIYTLGRLIRQEKQQVIGLPSLTLWDSAWQTEVEGRCSVVKL
jgi:hypothetical protein